MNSVCLVLEGGGMRGLYTAGVLDLLMDEGIEADGMVTVSAGALFGINYASGQQGRALRYNKKYIQDKRYMSIVNLIKTGNLINKEFAYYSLPFVLDRFDEKAFQQSNIDFYVTITNVEKGEPEYVKITNGYEQIDVLRASGSMPFVSNMVSIDGNQYLDGGISDSIPYNKAFSLGYDKIIVVLTRPLDYRKTKMNELAIDLFYRNYPELVKRMKNRYLDYNEQIAELLELEKKNEVFVIRPSEALQIKLLERDPEKLQETYDLGVHDSLKMLEELKDYLSFKF